MAGSGTERNILRGLAFTLLCCGAVRAQVPRFPPPMPPQPSGEVSSTGATKSNVVYGEAGHSKLKLDVYEPKARAAAPVPGIILIHGGSWSGGDKYMLAELAQYFASKGYVAFSINYRLHDGRSNRWPAQLDDAQTAVRWVRAHAADYGVDPGRIGAWGHSAGAQMASLLGELDTRDRSGIPLANYSSKVQAVVDVAGPADLTAFHNTDGDAMLASLLGATEQQNLALWKSASPVFNISKTTAPFLIVHGTRDGEVPIGQSVEFANALLKAGVSVDLVQVDNGHIFQDDAVGRKLALDSVQFFSRTLK